MKTINYRGKEYIVEDWVNFVAMDIDGDIYAFENEPEKDDFGEWMNIKGEVLQIDYVNNGWENSLEKV